MPTATSTTKTLIKKEDFVKQLKVELEAAGITGLNLEVVQLILKTTEKTAFSMITDKTIETKSVVSLNFLNGNIKGIYKPAGTSRNPKNNTIVQVDERVTIKLSISPFSIADYKAKTSAAKVAPKVAPKAEAPAETTPAASEKTSAQA